jgi:probable HAF family extracellular repeat protein
MRDLGTLGGAVSGAAAINARGQVVGYSSLLTDSLGHAFLWDSINGMHDLRTLGGDGSSASSINVAGQVVGSSEFIPGDNDRSHAFLWDRRDGLQDLGTLPGDTLSAAYAINATGQVVGISATTPGDTPRAVLWDSINGMQDLNDLVPPDSGWTISEASTINAAGQIASTGIASDGSVHGLLLTPDDPGRDRTAVVFLRVPDTTSSWAITLPDGEGQASPVTLVPTREMVAASKAPEGLPPAETTRHPTDFRGNALPREHQSITPVEWWNAPGLDLVAVEQSGGC